MVAKVWRQAGLNTADTALCLYAEKLTKSPDTINEADIDKLRKHGFTDSAIHDATQVIGYFNYINRIADALSVDQEDFVRRWELE